MPVPHLCPAGLWIGFGGAWAIVPYCQLVVTAGFLGVASLLDHVPDPRDVDRTHDVIAKAVASVPFVKTHSTHNFAVCVT